MSTKKPVDAAPDAPIVPKPAREGGSFVIGRDGKPVRQEYTRHPGDPDHEANATASAEPVKDA